MTNAYQFQVIIDANKPEYSSLCSFTDRLEAERYIYHRTKYLENNKIHSHIYLTRIIEMVVLE